VSNVEQLQSELETLPHALVGLAQVALTLAAGLDDDRASLAMKSMAARELVVTMDRIRELAPPARQKDFVDNLRDEVAEARARKPKAQAQ
jgi:hypothetical protein